MATWKVPANFGPPKAPDIVTPVVEASGFDELIGRLSLLPQVATAAAMDGLLNVANDVMDDSKENYCPFLNGILRQSGVVYGQDDKIILQYGGEGSGAEEYALEQHENMTYHHPIGTNKYLERPMIEWNDRIVERCGLSVRSEIEKDSKGWASGDWQEIKVINDERANLTLVKGYVKKGGKEVATYARRKAKVSR